MKLFILALLFPVFAVAGDWNADTNSSADAGAAAQSGAISNITFNTNGVAETTTRYEGEYTVKTVPAVYAPSIGVTAPCRVAVSGGVSVTGFGFAFGASPEDAECTRRETARLLYQMNEPVAAIKVMCNNAEAKAALGSKCEPMQ